MVKWYKYFLQVCWLLLNSIIFAEQSFFTNFVLLRTEDGGGILPLNRVRRTSVILTIDCSIYSDDIECVKKMDSCPAEKCGELFNTVNFVSKQEVSFTSYPILTALQEKNGLYVGGFYRSDNACRRYTYVN